MMDAQEKQRLEGLYEGLRLRLLDLSRKNQLLNYNLRPRSKRFLQLIGTSLETVYRGLVVDEASLVIQPLPEPDSIPSDERTEEFRAALERAMAVDVEYLTALEALEASGRDDEAALEKLERELRDRVRASLDMRPRPARKDVNRAEHARALGIDPSPELHPTKHNGRQDGLRTLKFPDELESLLEKIHGDARLAEQEMGLSTLYLAFGFLEWYESDSSDKKSFAPLLLLPVRIERQKAQGKTIYALSLREGQAEANLSLQKLVEQRFSRQIPDFGAEADTEEAVPSVEDYVQSVIAAVDGLKRWTVRRWLVLGHFSFGRFAMYQDLDSQNWPDHVARPLVGSILRGAEQGADEAKLPGIPDDYEIDQPEVERIAPYLIQDADASQHSALVDVMKGKNLVIQGPPGTGKSQTITNIIANALAAGRRVLFLAEKQAALEVVKRRLDRAGLGDFCLELHSDKSSPKSVIASLEARFEAGLNQRAAGPRRADPAWRKSKQEIGAYVQALHARLEDGVTPFTLIWEALRRRSDLGELAAQVSSVKMNENLVSDASRCAELAADLDVYAEIATAFAGAFGPPAQSPWNRIEFLDFPAYDASRFVAALRAALDCAGAARDLVARYAHMGFGDVRTFAKAAAAAPTLPDLPEFELAEIAGLELHLFEAALDARLERETAEQELEFFDELKGHDPDALAPAARHMACALGAEFGELSPAEAYARAEEEIASLNRVVSALDAFRPVVTILGLSSETPARDLPGVAAAAKILASASAEQRRWVGALASVPVTAVLDLVRRRDELLAEEADLRRRASGYDAEARPDPQQLRRAAAVLRESGFAKFLGTLSGKARAARTLAAKLGSDPDPVLLERLAAHIHDVASYESNREAAGLLGDAWSGLRTPLDEIASGLECRDELRAVAKMAGAPNDVVERILLSAPESAPQLLAHEAAIDEMCVLSHEDRRWLGDQPVAQTVPALRSRMAQATAFLANDPSRTLLPFGSTLRQIALAHGIASRRASAADRIASNPAATAALAVAPEKIAQARAAIRWVEAVRSANFPEALTEAFLSQGAAAARTEFLEGVSEWRGVEAEWQAIRASLAEFGAGSLGDIARDDLMVLVGELVDHADELADFISIRKLRQQLREGGLTDFLAACDGASVEPSRVPDVFAAVLVERRAAMARRSEPLRMANGSALEAHRKAFRERDRLKIDSDRKAIRAALMATEPPVGSNNGPRSSWTEMRLLQNEFGKQRRFAPVRQLLTRAGGAIQALKPCFMMSPLSLAKFVPAGGLHFDVLVIDEASQMRPEDALGGLLRAGQIVVVGDARQLPPTDFFARGDVAEAEEDMDDVDAESILEACEKTFGERRRLKWHYRSRCESLIAFSNRAFYDNSLITFPMARPGSFSVDFVRVDGVYRAQCNPAEAQRVVEEAIRFMRCFAEAPDDELPSLGIVAVNLQQREFILEELRRASAGDLLVEKYIERVEAKGEHLFVKNLENVQGDERDHIFISLTYGKKQGEPSLSQNFGPINRKQGHRRLNVLFTRARIRIGLFASFGSADVRIEEKSSEGVRALKAYLEYAETRGRAMAHAPSGEPDSDFEWEVADRLRLRGYKVDLQVGVSRQEEKGKNFRIDLAVWHPDHPEHYLAGVECDGASYHSSKSARDRDRLREEVLRSLGWRLVRVWSTDWFDNPSRETDKLVAKLEELRKENVTGVISYPPLLRERVDPVACPESHHGNPQPLPAQETSAKAEQPSPNAAQGRDLLAGSGALTPDQAAIALAAFRDAAIAPASDNWEPERSLLRPAMIETFVQQRITDPDQWYTHVPQYQRQGTNPTEKKAFLEQVCAIVERIR